jgi:small subunit ribosomal protein S30e
LPIILGILDVYNKYENPYTYVMPTHGSLTKAGKVRGQTPKIQARERTSPSSKVRNKNNFVKRFEKRIQPGQKKPERMHRR